jgi:hypothetical protein
VEAGLPAFYNGFSSFTYMINMSATIYIRKSFKLFTTSALFVLATSVGGAEGLTSEFPAFKFQLQGNTTNPHCVATQLQPPHLENVSKVQQPAEETFRVIHALTAAHCFSNVVKSIHIGCRDNSTKETQVTSFSRHPTHDAVYMELLVENSCLEKGVSVRHQALGKQHQHQKLYIPAVVKPTGEAIDVASLDSAANRVATILSVDQETLRIADPVACLKAGDSGYPLLLNGQLVAMLISGLDGCPTEQIGIRIDKIAAWIGMQWIH